MEIKISKKTLFISKKTLFFLIIVLSIGGFSLISIKIGLINCELKYQPTYIQNQTNIYLQECKDCPAEFKPYFLYVWFNKTIDQDIEIIIPDGQHAVIHSSSFKQLQTIGYCMCDGNKVSSCNLFWQYRTKPNIESNYTIADFSNMPCENKPLPYV